MAHYRETPCKHYVSYHECKKGREACQSGYCQHCNQYDPRVKEKHINKKKHYLDKLKRTESY